MKLKELSRRWFGKPAGKSQSERHCSLNVETLEGRELPAVVAAVNVAGFINIASDSTPSWVEVKYTSGGKVRVHDYDNGFNKDFPMAGLLGAKVLIFQGGAGKDYFKNLTFVPCSLYGKGGDDTLIGGAGCDYLNGGAGNDLLYGGAGNDNLFGSTGIDKLYGQSGNDFLDAGTVLEPAYGGAGENFDAYAPILYGAKGSDIDQNATPTCWVLASMAAAAQAGIDMGSRITYIGSGKYHVQLLDENGGSHYQIVSLTTPRYSFEPGSPNATPDTHWNESWVLLIHRAIMQQRGVDWSNKDAYGSGWPSWSLPYLTGRPVQNYGNEITGGNFNTTNNAEMVNIQSKLSAGKLVVATTRQGNFDTFNILGSVNTPQLIGAHCYAVVSVNIADRKITLRNPWGTDVGSFPGGLPSGDPDDGLVSITFSSFYGSMWSYSVS